MPDLFLPLRPETAYQQVCAQIEARILERALRPGDLLPTETDLARQFSVNRSTVREALRTLESRGLVCRRPGKKRLSVAQPDTDSVAIGVSHALVMHEVSFLEVWEAMMLLEPEVAALAARRRSAAQLHELRRSRAVLEQADVPAPQAVAAIAAFFRTLGRACGNRALELAVEPLTRLLEPSLSRMIDRVPQARRRIADAQDALLAALARRDAGAARQWMVRHVRDFRRGYELAGITLSARVETHPAVRAAS
jgi:GntR family transcriptional regulator, transcriptional repressor for pyruvate dehydrogenase complex